MSGLWLQFAPVTLAQSESYLGQVKLTYAENDLNLLKIQDRCSNTQTQGYQAVRLQVDQGTANIKGLRVKYYNGKWDWLRTWHNLQQGNSTRWIVLRGDRRCLEEIAVLGDTRNSRARNYAMIKVYARK